MIFACTGVMVDKDNLIWSRKEAALSRFSGEFVDKATELKFLQAGWDDRRRQLRTAMIILGPAYFLAGIGDYMILGLRQGFWIMAMFRTLELLGAMVVFLLSSNVRRASALAASILITELVITTSTTFRIILMPTNLPEGFLFMILIFYFLVPNRLLLTALVCTLMMFSPLVGLWLVGRPLPDLIWMAIFAILFNLLGFFVVRNRNQLQRREYLSRLQIVQAAQAATEASEKLRVSEERFRDFVTGVPIGFFSVSMDGAIIETNPAILEIFGFESVKEADQFGLLNLYCNPEDRSRLIQDVLQGPVTGYELMFRRSSGQSFPARIHARIVRDEAGRPLFLDGTLEDITERKLVEQKLRESEQRLTYIINFLPVATMVIDHNGTVTAWNRAMENLTGVKSRDIIGKGNYEYALPFYGEKRPILIDYVLLSGKELSGKYSNIHREGDILSAEAFIPNLGENGIILVGFASALYDESGKVIGAIESIQDMTEIRNVEAQLKKAKDAADEANRSKSAFLANMSHEIRTPMNAILGFTQLMERDTDISSQSRNYLGIINRSGEHLLSLINDILEMSKIEAGRTTLIPSTFDLHALIEDIERMFRIRAEGKGLNLLTEIVGQVPRWAITDEGKLRQVIINLLGNAVKFTEKGGIALRLRTQSNESADAVDLQFEVEDTGPGMTDEELGRLFQVFEQTSAGIKSGGTGLGLALSRGFIQIMGGTISVTSAIGKGSLFRFGIPVRKGRAEDAPLVGKSKNVLRLKPGREEIRVLIADDRDTNRQLLSQLLGAVGFATREAVNGESAVQVVRKWRPHLVLMDMAMPVMDGYDAIRIIKASPEMKDTKILAVTASAFAEDKQRVFASGADDYLLKPFKAEELFDKVGRLTAVQYLYEDEDVNESEPDKAAELSVLYQWVATLPPELVKHMMEAVESADIEQLNELVGEWADDQPALARRTREMAANYEYETLIGLFNQEKDS